MTNRFKITIAYEGTHYSGWQQQPAARSIQETVATHLHTLLRHPVKLVGSGRTDAGVHALAQVAHFDTDTSPDPNTLLRSLNGLLPHDIRILAVEPVPTTFHSQLTARGKEYHYRICTDPVLLPFDRGYRWHVRYSLDLELLQKAAQLLTGTHDFASFANVGSTPKGSVRTVFRIELVPEAGGFRLEFEGNGFLYKMVRNLTGTLIRVASGQLSLDAVREILEKKDRREAPMGAPGYGLYLVRVDYHDL